MPAKVRIPPGPPEVMPLTAIRPRLITPVGVEIVGLPVNCSDVNLNTAPPMLFWPLISASNPLAVSKAEVEPKMNADKGPSRAWPRQILPKSVTPLVVIDGSVVMVVPLVMTYGFGEVIVDGVPNLLGGGGGGGGGGGPKVFSITTGFAVVFRLVTSIVSVKLL